MTALNENNYYVIQFTELPNESIEKYRIVPRSWIKICKSRNVVLVAYPDEDSEKTKTRVEKNQKHRKKWNFFEALLRYESSNYKDAYTWIAAKNIFNSVHSAENNNSSDDSGNNTVTENVSIQNIHSNTDTSNESTPPKKIKTRSAVPDTPAAHNTNKPQTKLDAWTIEKRDSLKLSFKRTGALHQGLETCNKKTQRQKIGKIRSSKINHTKRKCPGKKKSGNLAKHLLNELETTPSHQGSLKLSHSNGAVNIKPAEMNYIQVPSQHTNNLQSFGKNCRTETNMPSSSPSPNQCVRVSEMSQVELETNSFDCQVQHSDKNRGIDTGMSVQMPTLQKMLQTSPSIIKQPMKTANQDTPTNQFQIQKTDATPKNLQDNNKSNISNIPTAEQNAPNQSSPFSDHKPKIKGLLLEDPCTGILFLRKLYNEVVQVQAPAYQTGHSSDKCNCRPPVHMNTDYLIKESNLQQYANGRPKNMINLDQKCCAHNNPYVKRDSSSIEHVGSSSPNHKQISLTPGSSEEERSDDTEIPKSTENNHRDSSNFNVTNIEDKSFAIHNAESKTNQLLPAYQVKSEADISDNCNDRHDDDDTRCNVKVKDNGTVRKRNKSEGTLVLPPEYDPNNSRWTLKHRNPGPGIVELIPHSQVYIDAHRLDKCKRIARNSNALGRMLLTEIFSLNALRVCDLAGAKFCYCDGSKTRPGLDDCARTTLLKFVTEYAEQRHGHVNMRGVIDSIRYKMRRLRNDGQSTESSSKF